MVRDGIKTRRITTRQRGAASIAPTSGRMTSPPRETKLAAAPGKVKNNNPSSGRPAAINAPLTLNVRQMHTPVKSKKQQATPNQLRLIFKSSPYSVGKFIFRPLDAQSDGLYGIPCLNGASLRNHEQMLLSVINKVIVWYYYLIYIIVCGREPQRSSTPGKQ